MKATITKSKTSAATIGGLPTPDDGRLCIRATKDGLFAVSETYAGVYVEPIPGVAEEPGDAWVLGARLAGIVKLADHDISIEGPIRDAPQRGPHHRVTSGKYRAILTDRDIDVDFGLLSGLPAPAGSAHVKAEDLAAAILGVRSVAESKRNMNADNVSGVMLEAEAGVLRAVSTDGHRMAVSVVPADLELSTTVLVPDALRDLMPWLLRRSGFVEVHVDKSMLWLFGAGAVFGHRVKARTYFDWRRIWAKPTGKPCRLQPRDVLRARQSLSGLDVTAVRLALDGGSATIKTVGDGDEAEVDAGAGEGDSGSVTLDPLYLAAANDLASGDLEVKWPIDAHSPVLFRGAVCAHLIMPRR